MNIWILPSWGSALLTMIAGKLNTGQRCGRGTRNTDIGWLVYPSFLSTFFPTQFALLLFLLLFYKHLLLLLLLFLSPSCFSSSSSSSSKKKSPNVNQICLDIRENDVRQKIFELGTSFLEGIMVYNACVNSRSGISCLCLCIFNDHFRPPALILSHPKSPLLPVPQDPAAVSAVFLCGRDAEVRNHRSV